MDKNKNSSRYHRNNNSHMDHARSRTTRSTTYVYSLATPIRGKYRQFEARQDIFEREINSVLPEGPKHQFPSNFTIQSSRKMEHTESPSVERSPETSPKPGIFYAGAKFSETPSPGTIPKPPMHWTSCTYMAPTPWISPERADNSIEMSNLLKRLLKV